MLIIWSGHKVPIQVMTSSTKHSWLQSNNFQQDQEAPGLQSELKGPDPQSDKIPTEDGGYQLYRSANKLENKRAIITGGDSGIGRAAAILFAMEGADSFIAYLPEEETDAQETKRLVAEKGRKCYLHATDLREAGNCKIVVEEAVKAMGGIDVLFNNAAFQMMVEDISDLSEYGISQVLYLPPLSYWLVKSQGTMDQDIQHKHPPILLSRKIQPPPHEKRRNNHKQR